MIDNSDCYWRQLPRPDQIVGVFEYIVHRKESQQCACRSQLSFSLSVTSHQLKVIFHKAGVYPSLRYKEVPTRPTQLRIAGGLLSAVELAHNSRIAFRSWHLRPGESSFGSFMLLGNGEESSIYRLTRRQFGERGDFKAVLYYTSLYFSW